MKTLFQNAKVVDGSGEPAFLADVLVENDRIVGIHRLSESRAFQEEKKVTCESQKESAEQTKDNACRYSDDNDIKCVDVA